jgi:polyisoprenoid-binding protein YceI
MGILIRCRLAAIICVLLTIAVSVGSSQTTEEFRIDAASSKMVVHVGRSGLFAFAGHDHEVAVPGFTGRLTLDRTDVSRSKLSVQFDAAAMTVTGKGEPPEDVPEVQRVMLSDRVLDVERHPKIAFVSRSISLVERSTDRVKVRIDGELTLRGITRPVTVPSEIRLSDDGLTATGKATVRQTLFGIRPVTAGAGTVRVKDDVEVVFTVVARPAK